MHAMQMKMKETMMKQRMMISVEFAAKSAFLSCPPESKRDTASATEAQSSNNTPATTKRTNHRDMNPILILGREGGKAKSFMRSIANIET